jgi:cupin fold WbuC family metalloprotein
MRLNTNTGGTRLKQLTDAMLEALSEQAGHSPRRRANFNLHPDLSDPIQRLAIAMEPETHVRPHRHPHTWEMLFPLRGRFVVLHFDDGGTVVDRVLLGEDAQIIESPAGIWHAVLSLDRGGIIFEVKHGPYTPIADADYAPWAPADAAAAAGLNAWYASARIGDTLGE